MMVRAEVIADVGLMDEDFFMYCEEIDWCWRMQDAGWKTLCVPTAHVIHHAGRSSAQVRIPAFVRLWKSRARLYARHHGPLTRWLAKLIVHTGMKARQRKGSPEMVDACQEVIQAWKETV
jgi:GT2 family glycosyltransferase